MATNWGKTRSFDTFVLLVILDSLRLNNYKTDHLLHALSVYFQSSLFPVPSCSCRIMSPWWMNVPRHHQKLMLTYPTHPTTSGCNKWSFSSFYPFFLMNWFVVYSVKLIQSPPRSGLALNHQMPQFMKLTPETLLNIIYLYFLKILIGFELIWRS